MRPSRDELLIRAFSAVIKARRLSLSLTQEDLAGRIEIDRPYITLLEAGAKQPTISVFWKIAKGLELSGAELASLVDDHVVRLNALSKSAAVAKRATTRVKPK